MFLMGIGYTILIVAFVVLCIAGAAFIAYRTQNIAGIFFVTMLLVIILGWIAMVASTAEEPASDKTDSLYEVRAIPVWHLA